MKTFFFVKTKQYFTKHHFSVHNKRFMQSAIAPCLGITVTILIILCCAKNAENALASLFTGSFITMYAFGSFLNTASLLMVAGVGASIAIKSGNMNLGGEGQVYLGGYVAAVVLTLPMHTSPIVIFLTALIASLLAGACMALLSAVLYELRGALVLLTTFLISAAAIPLVDGAITASNGNTNLLATPFIAKELRLVSLLKPSPLNYSFFISLLLCILSYFFLFKTYSGRKMQVWGSAPLFAKYCGYSSIENSFLSLSISGALHALTGFFAVAGTYYTCHKGFYSGMGWNALSAALIAQSNPLAIIPVSLVLSWLYTSADRVALTQGFGFDISGIIQGVVLFSIAIPFTVDSIHAERQKKQTAGDKK